MTSKDCPHCRERTPHRRSEYRCTGCKRAFARYHVPPEENGVRLCLDCRAKLHDSTKRLF